MNPEIVLGPPGTGKTTTLLGYVEDELAAGVEPDRIGYVSFTRRAADEARDRAMKKFSLKKSDLPWFRTIHSLCFAALGLSSSEVLEGQTLVEFGDWLGVQVSGHVSMDEGTSFGFELGDRCLFMENLSRVRGIPLRQQYDENSDGIPWNIVERVGLGLAEYKRQKGLVDFTDMLSQFADSQWSARLDRLFVDEGQDLSWLQWRVVARLSEGAERVVIAGDDDQAIYAWAGADVAHFVSMPGRERVLERSWRVPSAVQEVALGQLSLIAPERRRAKTWLPREGDAGAVARVGSLDDVDFVAGEDMLVLSRNTCFLRDDAMPLLRSDGVLYEHRGQTSVRQSLVEAILDWERLRNGGEVSVADAEKIYQQFRVCEGFARGHKKLPAWTDREQMVTMADLTEAGGLLTDVVWHDAMLQVSPTDRAYMLRALRRGEKLTRRPSVRLSTIHGSKGGQADHVVLLRDMAWRTHRERVERPEDEARCWYVAATRARKKLTIVAPQSRQAERWYDI